MRSFAGDFQGWICQGLAQGAIFGGLKVVDSPPPTTHYPFDPCLEVT